MRTLFFYIFTFLSHLALSQEFSQINQTPLLYHPSFVGSTGNGRLSLIGNFSSNGKENGFTNPGQKINNYLSYDNLWKKKGIGWGGSAQTSNYRVEDGERLINGNLFGSISYTSYTLAANAYLATKHAILSSSNRKPKFTLSPSFSFGYMISNGIIKNSGGNVSIPKTSTYQFGTTQATFGILLNSENGYLGLSYSNRYHTYSLMNLSISDSAILTPAFKLVAAKTFFSNMTNGKFSITPSGYYVINGYYKKPNELVKSTKNGILNLTATIWKMYVGASYSTLTISNRNIFAGFQNKHLRTGIGYGWSTETELRSFLELSFSYFFQIRSEGYKP